MEEESGGDEFFHPSTCIFVAQFCFCVREKLLFSVRRNKMCERRGRKNGRNYIFPREHVSTRRKTKEKRTKEFIFLSVNSFSMSLVAR